MFDEKGVYSIFAKSGEERGNAFLTLGSESPYGYDIKQEKSLSMIGFAHGQTLETLTVGKSKKKYFMFAGRSDNHKQTEFNKWATEIAFVKTDSINKKLKEDNSKIIYNVNSPKSIRRITNIGCANKSGTSKGAVKRVDGALSTDKSVLVIWCQFTNGGIQVSLYNMKAIRSFIAKSSSMKTFSLKSAK